ALLADPSISVITILLCRRVWGRPNHASPDCPIAADRLAGGELCPGGAGLFRDPAARLLFAQAFGRLPGTEFLFPAFWRRLLPLAGYQPGGTTAPVGSSGRA